MAKPGPMEEKEEHLIKWALALSLTGIVMSIGVAVGSLLSGNNN